MWQLIRMSCCDFLEYFPRASSWIVSCVLIKEHGLAENAVQSIFSDMGSNWGPSGEFLGQCMATRRLYKLLSIYTFPVPYDVPPRVPGPVLVLHWVMPAVSSMYTIGH